MELADWLTDCRNVVIRENYDTEQEYISDVDRFCEQWEYFYKQNEETFKKYRERFKKALVFALYKQNISYEVDYGTKQLNAYQSFQNASQSIFSERLLEEIDQDYSVVYDLVKEIFEAEEGYKDRLHYVIVSQCLKHTKIKIRAFEDGEWVKTATYDEFKKKCEKQKYYIEFKTQSGKNSYYKVFEQYDISKSVYADFRDEKTCQQEFGKKFFINMGFMLGLNLSLVEKLLNFNGYTILNKSREFDVLCEKAFRIGFGREYTIALINKYNSELAKKGGAYKLMPTITKTQKRTKI